MLFLSDGGREEGGGSEREEGRGREEGGEEVKEEVREEPEGGSEALALAPPLSLGERDVIGALTFHHINDHQSG